MNQAYVYILSNLTKVLYIGVTADLARRLWDHRYERHYQSFTLKYNLDRLVYYECIEVMRDAIAREKQLKGWIRAKKLKLILITNPNWKDLCKDFPSCLDFSLSDDGYEKTIRHPE